jgi:hypothetical protein
LSTRDLSGDASPTLDDAEKKVVTRQVTGHHASPTLDDAEKKVVTRQVTGHHASATLDDAEKKMVLIVNRCFLVSHHFGPKSFLGPGRGRGLPKQFSKKNCD